MAETIIINAATREIKVPDSEINFGVAGERKIERKHFRIEGRTYKGVDLADGFAWKVSCENAAKKPCADLIDSIVADATGIEFDWVVGAAPMAFKGELKFSVCAKRTNSLAEILNEWHSRIGTGIVNAGLEATVEDIGGYDLAAQLQQKPTPKLRKMRRRLPRVLVMLRAAAHRQLPAWQAPRPPAPLLPRALQKPLATLPPKL